MEKIDKEEYEKVIVNYFSRSILNELPRYRKKRLILLKAFSMFFQKENYTEKEVNEIIKGIIAKIPKVKIDHVKIRRALIDECFLYRTNDGSKYFLRVSDEIKNIFADEINNIDIFKVINNFESKR